MANESLSEHGTNQPFPLKVTAFEEFMLRDDRVTLPMSFFIEIGLSGDIDRDELDAAFREALNRHPMLSARIRSSWLRESWIEGPPDCRIQWLTAADGLPASHERWIDIRNSGGLRCWVLPAGESVRVIFQFHHASTDGIGALRFIGDLLALYGLRTTSAEAEPPVLMPAEHTMLARRGEFWQSARPANFWPRLLFRLKEVLGQFPRPLAHSASANLGRSDTSPVSRRLFVTRILENRELRRLNKAAADRAITPNDILTWAVFQTLQQWNRHLNQDSPGRVYRIILPTNLRTPDYEHCSAANVISYSVITKSSAEISHESLLSVIAQESTVSVSGQEAGMVLMCLNLGRRVPGLLRAFTALPLCLSTAVLTNVGDVRRQFGNKFPLRQGKIMVGNATMDYLLGAAPIRPSTHLAVSLGKYAGRLLINLNVDPVLFSDDDAEQLADLYIEQIRRIEPVQEDAS